MKDCTEIDLVNRVDGLHDALFALESHGNFRRHPEQIGIDAINHLENKLRQSLSLVLTWKNASCPIQRLPPEILARIFEIHQEPQSSSTDSMLCAPSAFDSYPEFTFDPHYKWIQVTHVCRYWRHTALSSPQLWHRIIIKKSWVDSMALSQLVLSRSGAVPLHLFIISVGIAQVQTLQALLEEVSTRITLLVIARRYMPLINYALSYPQLTRLVYSWDTQWSLGWGGENGRYSPVDLGSRMTKLRELYIDHLTYCSSINISLLTCLCLAMDTYHPTPTSPSTRQVSIRRLLILLEDAQNLEELLVRSPNSFHTSAGLDPHQVDPSLPSVSLPKLRLLVLDDLCGTDCSQILFSLKLPDGIVVRVNIVFPQDCCVHRDFYSISDAISQTFTETYLNKTTQIYLRLSSFIIFVIFVGETFTLSINIGFTELYRDENDDDTNIQQYPPSPIPELEMVASVGRAIDLSRIRVLDIDEYPGTGFFRTPPHPQMAWLSMLDNIDSFCVTVYNEHYYMEHDLSTSGLAAFIPLQSQILSLQSPEDQQSFASPRLSKVRIIIPSRFSEWEKVWYEELKKALEERANKGYILDEVEVVRFEDDFLEKHSQFTPASDAEWRVPEGCSQRINIMEYTHQADIPLAINVPDVLKNSRHPVWPRYTRKT
ncbi:hypothetical protein ABKN59_011277 [Abortiporus biennis]